MNKHNTARRHVVRYNLGSVQDAAARCIHPPARAMRAVRDSVPHAVVPRQRGSGLRPVLCHMYSLFTWGCRQPACRVWRRVACVRACVRVCVCVCVGVCV
jgi:hypothetical protein